MSGMKRNEPFSKHTISLQDETWDYLLEQAANNKLTVSELIDRTCDHMRNNNKAIKLDYCVFTKGEKNGNKTK